MPLTTQWTQYLGFFPKGGGGHPSQRTFLNIQWNHTCLRWARRGSKVQCRIWYVCYDGW